MDLLPKIFIKDYKNYENAKVRFAYGNLCGLVGIISNTFLCLAKIIIGLIVGSIAIVADGINNLADAGSSLITIIGFKIAKRPSSKEHPFGHERAEYIAGLIVSFVIIVVGVFLMKSSIDKLIVHEEMIYETRIAIVTIVILSLAIILKCWQSSFYRRYGRKIKSTALIATSVDSLNDCISTSAVLISSIVMIIWPNGYVDGIMGIIVSLFIVISGIKLVKETISPLIGEAPTKEFVDMVKNKILAYEGVYGIHDLVIHSYGPKKIFITVHVEVDSHESINVTHDIIDNIENDFRINDGINLVIHMDPIDFHDEEVRELRERIKEILESIDKSLLFHDFRIVKGITHTNLIFDVVIPFGFKLDENEIKNEIDNKLSEYNETLKTVITFDTDYTGGENE